MSAAAASRALLRLELSDALRARWLVVTGAVYAVLFGAFVWLGLRESEVLGFTGLSRVVLNLANAITLAVPLVALVATAQTIVRARQSGFFELMLSEPVRRADWFSSILASRLFVVVAPLAVLFGGVLLVAPLVDAHDASLVPIVLRSLATTAALAWAFVGIGLWVSAAACSPERATVLALLVWLAASALHDFALVGALLRFKLAPAIVFAVAASNPAEAVRIAILSGVDPDLSVLGPVGFWLANALGPRLALGVGVGWPALLGALAVWRAQRRLAHSDLVG
ncbi:MAG TPA: ABC transporter permease subunit [Polyangiaceae bacterium]|jgi:ABC-2 type transport system permease protein